MWHLGAMVTIDDDFAEAVVVDNGEFDPPTFESWDVVLVPLSTGLLSNVQAIWHWNDGGGSRSKTVTLSLLSLGQPVVDRLVAIVGSNQQMTFEVAKAGAGTFRLYYNRTNG